MSLRGCTRAWPRRSACSAKASNRHVVIKGVNDDELVDLVEYGKSIERRGPVHRVHDVGGATKWSADRVVSRVEILAASRRTTDRSRDPSSTAHAGGSFALPDGTTIGIISSTTSPFCQSCDRSRLTADGMLVTSALCGKRHRPARAAGEAARPSTSSAAIIRAGWTHRSDRRCDALHWSLATRAFCTITTLKKIPTSKCTLGGAIGEAESAGNDCRRD